MADRAKQFLVEALQRAKESLTDFDNIDTTTPRKGLDFLLKRLGGRIPEEVREAWKLVVNELAQFEDSMTLSPEFGPAVSTLIAWLDSQLAKHQDKPAPAPAPSPAAKPPKPAAGGAEKSPKADAAAPTG